MSRWVRLWWCLVSRWWRRRWLRREPVDPWCRHCWVLDRDPFRNPRPRRFWWPNSVTKLQDFSPSTCSHLYSRLSSTSLSFREGCHEIPQGRKAFVSFLDLPVVALLNVDDIVTMVLQDFRSEHQRLLNLGKVIVNLPDVRPCNLGKMPQPIQLRPGPEDRWRKTQDASEMIHRCSSLAAQLGVLLDEVIDRCLQRHRIYHISLIVDLLVVASPCVPKMDDLTLPLIEHRVECVLD